VRPIERGHVCERACTYCNHSRKYYYFLMNTQKGFASVLLILLGLVVIGGGVYVYSTQRSATTPDSEEIFQERVSLTEAASEDISAQASPADTQKSPVTTNVLVATYSNQEFRISINYPANQVGEILRSDVTGANENSYLIKMLIHNHDPKIDGIEVFENKSLKNDDYEILQDFIDSWYGVPVIRDRHHFPSSPYIAHPLHVTHRTYSLRRISAV
jgi:cbb3-type cytochrome oxidase subunit 3